MKTIFSIHPAIGIARLGDSDVKVEPEKSIQEAFFLGPEAPNTLFQPTPYNNTTDFGKGSYRDGNKKIRRQGARFRIYKKEIDRKGVVHSASEITKTEATITWKVSLANKKASAERFPPYHKKFIEQLTEHKLPNSSENYPNMVMRNFHIDDAAERGDKLVIVDEGLISSKRIEVIKLKGRFFDHQVALGQILTDEKGRLIVLGGQGKSISDTPDRKMLEPSIFSEVAGNPSLQGEEHRDLRDQITRHRLYNWDGWCYDTSDGKIEAKITLNDGQEIEAESAWIIVAPPDYAAAVKSPITLFDVAFNAERKVKRVLGIAPPIPDKISFRQYIYPILKRTVDLQYADDRVRLGHSENKSGDFAHQYSILSSLKPEHKTMKVRFLQRLTKPGAVGGQIDMPDLYGGVDPDKPQKLPPLQALRDSSLERRDRFGVALTLTKYQFVILNKWADHEFVDDWIDGSEPIYPELSDIQDKDQPAALDEAALEQCNGGSFHPGIEASFVMARSDTYRTFSTSWFRISNDKKPGDLTKNLAVPWQHDFVACSEIWWPGQRPVSVPINEKNEEGKLKYKEWLSEDVSLSQIFEFLKNAGFLRYHPEAPEGERIYLDMPEEEMLLSLLDTGSEEAKQLRKKIAQLRENGRVS